MAYLDAVRRSAVLRRGYTRKRALTFAAWYQAAQLLCWLKQRYEGIGTMIVVVEQSADRMAVWTVGVVAPIQLSLQDTLVRGWGKMAQVLLVAMVVA